MKTLVTYITLLLVLVFSCKRNTKETQHKEDTKIETSEKTIPEKIAHAHGYDHWKEVNTINFTFNVDIDTMHIGRSWSWQPKKNLVSQFSTTDTITYARVKVDSTLANIDSKFINDKFWLLAPYQLIWDRQNYTDTYMENAVSPLRQMPLHKLTIVYKNNGGYTPGDAYDFYFGDDYVVKEWVYRKANGPEPGRAYTWEGYETFNGLKIATEHKQEAEDFKLYFTGISVE